MTERKRFQILVCDGPSCGITHESETLVEHIEGRLDKKEAALEGRAECAALTCFGRCDEGPNLMIRELAPGEDGSTEPDFDLLYGVRGLYLGVDQAKVDRILDSHVAKDEAVEEWVESYE